MRLDIPSSAAVILATSLVGCAGHFDNGGQGLEDLSALKHSQLELRVSRDPGKARSALESISLDTARCVFRHGAETAFRGLHGIFSMRRVVTLEGGKGVQFAVDVDHFHTGGNSEIAQPGNIVEREFRQPPFDQIAIDTTTTFPNGQIEREHIKDVGIDGHADEFRKFDRNGVVRMFLDNRRYVNAEPPIEGFAIQAAAETALEKRMLQVHAACRAQWPTDDWGVPPK